VPECAAEGETVKNNVGLFLQKRAQLNPGLEAFIDTPVEVFDVLLHAASNAATARPAIMRRPTR